MPRNLPNHSILRSLTAYRTRTHSFANYLPDRYLAQLRMKIFEITTQKLSPYRLPVHTFHLTINHLQYFDARDTLKDPLGKDDQRVAIQPPFDKRGRGEM